MKPQCNSLRLAPLLAAAWLAVSPAVRADVVTDWNVLAVSLPIDAPPVMARLLATMHGAMHDAVNSVDPRYESYRFTVSAAAGASKEAAAAAAAHDVLAGLVPAQRAAFDAALARSLGSLADGPAKADGMAVGSVVAAKMLAWRAGDGFGAMASDHPGTAPGVWQRTPPAMAPGVLPQFGAMTPFVLTSGSQFAARQQPALDSTAFAADLNEVKAIGARKSSARSGEQTDAAIFWSGNEVPILNAAARAVAQVRKLSLNENARLFALLNMAQADAAIEVFRIKYQQNAWRPITAIRNATTTGNAAVTADADWVPLLTTPPHPEFPSGHCILAGAAGQVMRAFFDSDQIQFSYTSPHGLATTRSFNSLAQLEKEVEDARVWGGIHFRSTDEESTRLGHEVGAYAVATFMRPR